MDNLNWYTSTMCIGEIYYRHIFQRESGTKVMSMRTFVSIVRLKRSQFQGFSFRVSILGSQFQGLSLRVLVLGSLFKGLSLSVIILESQIFFHFFFQFFSNQLRYYKPACSQMSIFIIIFKELDYLIGEIKLNFVSVKIKYGRRRDSSKPLEK